MDHPSARRTGLVALGASAAVLAALVPTAAQADAHPSRLAAPTASARPSSTVVTLITGDKVTVTKGAGGRPGTVSVQRPPGATGSVRTSTEGGDTYVYPDDAMAYVASGLLDKRLFDVTQLVAQGYDNAHAAGLPLIVSHRKESAALRRDQAAALPGVKVNRALPSVGGEAVTADRSRARGLWSALTAGTGAPSGTAAAARSDAPAFADGVAKIWLDGKARATLADSTAQIGAPQVWNEGTTGAGVKVAVLDTGVDTRHPDLADRVTDTQSFVPDSDVEDRHGHGTHTASTVAGTGAASDGKEKGVAPGADLAIGKVLDDNGNGRDSWVIAGMEWAARTEHAKIISMSLGDPARRDGTDPMSQSLNALSAETGALFVVAAGNSYQSPYAVGSPGAADAALTVAAVDSSDQVAYFSSAGPREGDDALKPDISAPGVDILAARSQYSAEGEGYYTTMSGTSMATPHVAGAAALLAQQHPDWTGQQLKDALMSTSKPTPDFTAYQAGSGRVDAAAAVHATVTATGSVFGGLVQWPHDDTAPIDRRITYTNSGDSPVTLDLAVDAGTSPAGLFSLPEGQKQVTVPAHGSASVTVVVSPAGMASGTWTGQVLARDAAGTPVAHTAAAVSIEPERYGLTLTAKDRAGRPMAGLVSLHRASDGSVTYYQIPDSGSLTVRLAPDTYSAMMFAEVQGTHGPHSLGAALLGDPEVKLTADTTVAFDASRARQVRVLTPKPSVASQTRIEYYRSFTEPRPAPDNRALVENILLDPAYDSVWAQPSDSEVTSGSFVFTTRIRAEQAPLTLSYAGTDLDDVLVQPGASPLPGSVAKTPGVFAGDGAAGDYAGVVARGAIAVVRRSDTVSPAEQSAAAHGAGVRLLLVVNDGVGRLESWYGAEDGATAGPVPVASVTADEGEALIKAIAAARGHQVTIKVESHPAPSYVYDLNRYQVGAVGADQTLRADDRNLARIDLTFGQRPGSDATEARADIPPYLTGPGWTLAPEPVAPGRRTDWVSTDGGVKWQQSAQIRGWTDSQQDPVAYQPGSTQQDTWFAPVLRPRMLGTNLPVRNGDFMFMSVPGWGDAGTAHAGYAPYGNGLTQQVSLYQGDRLLGQADYPSVYGGNLSPERLPYRLVADTRGDPVFSPYSTSTHTEWGFFSAEADNKTLPLVQLDYGVDLDAAGKAGRRSDLTVTPSVTGDAQISSVEVEVSYDDGATWHRLDARKRNGAWRGTLNAPGTASFVSLRTTAKDDVGDSVTQSVVRAFGLR
ncbi:S8 family serine peptidase [Streptomyces brasiliensis]|uniref:Peptidase n=1 Tax=Streptomyces brasiliensis TaxID=1954 RepID=A0A917NQ41_9ACTN|nr:S8 family serine peptidase [Streptomyces brasiliensis]GGJ17584.1 peptidase [Streptomyces brasiliensis]